MQAKKFIEGQHTLFSFAKVRHLVFELLLILQAQIRRPIRRNSSPESKSQVLMSTARNRTARETKLFIVLAPHKGGGFTSTLV